LVSEKYNAMRPQPLFAPRWVILALLTGASILPHGARLLLDRKNVGWRRRLAAVTVLTRIRLWRTRRMLALLGHPGSPS
ncbi:MAG: hypothetical protein ACXW3S_11185, partial [Rhodoplanes sp.]